MIKTTGVAAIAERHQDVLAFHLHRYLAHWLAKAGVSQLYVTIGWDHSNVAGVTVEVQRTSTSATTAPWSFGQLRDAHRKSGARVIIERDGERLEALAIKEPSAEGVPQPVAFVLVADPLTDELIAELEVHAGEALRAARRNSVRLFFDDCDDTDVKSLLYSMLDELPQWTGCDVAAACVLANSLEAMAFDHASEADFYVMAERLYSDDETATRLVGLTVDTRDEIRTVVDDAIERLANGDRGPIVFNATADGYVDDKGRAAVSIGAVPGRPSDARSIVVPIVDDRHEEELIGFLCLAFAQNRDAPKSVGELLENIGAELGRVLRNSPLYSLSASRLRLVREIRAVSEGCVSHTTAPVAERRDELIASVVDLVQRATDVPAFSVGYIVGSEPRRVRYSASYGWTDFSEIEMLVDVPDDAHADSGVSALAVRLGRPVVLAGGRDEGDHAEFKNFLWVHEASGRIVDGRAPGAAVGGDGWTRLGTYYKPARKGAYATLAMPITFHGRALGVLALEVDRDTEWTWWAGYGGLLLWELLSSELAFALWALDRELNG